MSNYKPHLDAAKQVCLTALHHLDHGLIVAVKQHSGSVVDDPSEPARIILTLELEALDLPATMPSVEQQIDAHFGAPTVRGVPFLHGIMEEATRRAVDLEAKYGRGSRLATGEENGDDSLHVVKDSGGKDRMVIASLESGPVVKVPALTEEFIRQAIDGECLHESDVDSVVAALLGAQDEAMRGDE